MAPRGLDGEHVAIELRTPELRIGLHRGRNVASDYALLAKATPFLDRPARGTGATIVLEGGARFEDDGRQAWLGPGDVVVSDQTRRATEAHAGERSCVLILEWRHDVLGAPRVGAFDVAPLGPKDLRRVADIASSFGEAPSASGAVRLLDALRAWGLPFERVTAIDLERRVEEPANHAVATAVASSLSRLDGLPAIDELGEALAMHSRTLHRKLGALADDYAMPWANWRSALHLTRVLTAMRCLAAPGATTEAVARIAGFRSPAALCHTFAEAGLPSPGALARAARRDVLASWWET